MRRGEKGFTLIEVLLASIILSIGLLTILGAMMQCQKLMLASKRFETAQYVLSLGEQAYPLPTAARVTDDPKDNEQLNIPETQAEEVVRELELELPRDILDELKGYSFERRVDEYNDEDEVLKRNGGLYTVRTTVRWGGNNRGGKRDSETVVRYWRKAN